MPVIDPLPRAHLALVGLITAQNERMVFIPRKKVEEVVNKQTRRFWKDVAQITSVKFAFNRDEPTDDWHVRYERRLKGFVAVSISFAIKQRADEETSADS